MLSDLRNEFRDQVQQTVATLPDSSLDTLIKRATQRIESDFASDYVNTPRQQIERETGTITGNSYTLPNDFLRAKTVRVNGSIRRHIALKKVGENASVDQAELTLDYFKKLTPLVEDTDTNWVLDNADRLYIYATGIEYCAWNKEALQDRQFYLDLYDEARDQVGNANKVTPAGGWVRDKEAWSGFYSIYGGEMLFA